MKYRLLAILFFAVQIGFGQIYIDSYRFASAAPTNLLLDDYPGAAAAYSLRKLDKDYTGSAIQIRRSSDGNTQNIGFSGNDLDEAAINTFCSGTTCTVQTWYDQSGNGRDAVQTTVANQPLIYASGSVVLENGKPAIRFDGSNDFFNINTISILNLPQSAFFVSKTNPNSYMVGFCNIVQGYDYTHLYFQSNNTVYYSGSGDTWRGYSLNLITQNLSTIIDNLNPPLYYTNGILLSQNSTNVYAPTDNTYTGIGKRQNGYYSNGTNQELILYLSDLTSTRTSIETNINAYYSIY